jgi:hypothetical protein
MILLHPGYKLLAATFNYETRVLRNLQGSPKNQIKEKDDSLLLVLVLVLVLTALFVHGILCFIVAACFVPSERGGAGVLAGCFLNWLC